MVTRRLVPALFLVMAGCAQRPAVTAPLPLIPKNGPEAHVRVEYEGGIFNRRLSALFSVKRPAYVMVAHLGGDGVVRVLYPEDARESGWVPGGKLYRTDITTGDYDAAPGYWFMRPTFFRTMGARTDSYDGNGHGFVFMIASNVPLHFNRVSEFGLWNEHEFTGYATTSDPRRLVRDYANLVSANGRYTLDYASSYSSWGTYSYANSRMDCAMLSSAFGFTPWYFTGFGFGHRYGGYYSMGFPSCFNSSYDIAYFDHLRAHRYGVASWGGRPNSPVSSPAPTVPIASPKPIDPRSGRRDPLSPRPGGFGPTRLSYSPTGVTRRFDPSRRTTEAGERIHPAPSGWGRGPAAGWTGAATPHGGRDYTPRNDDRRSSPGSSTAGGSSSPGGSSSTSGSSTAPATPSPSSSGSAGGSGRIPVPDRIPDRSPDRPR